MHALKSKLLFLSLLLVGTFLQSCMVGGSSIKDLRNVGSITPNEKWAYVIGRVGYSVEFNKYGTVKEGYKKTSLTEVSVALTVCPSETRSEIFENRKCDFTGDSVPMGEFFVFKIKPTDKLAWMQIWSKFKVNPEIFEKDPEKKKKIRKALSKYKGGYAVSAIRDFYLSVEEPIVGGKVYFIGDVVVDLDKKSFLEYGDEVYENGIIITTMPKDLLIKDSIKEAKAFAQEKLKYEGEIVKPKLKLKKSKIESKFYHFFD